MTNKKMLLAAAALAGAALAAAGSARADGFKVLARDLSRAAQRARIARVAVLPFVPADSSSPREGWNISEKLVTQLVRQDRVKAVERSLLKQVMDEHRLGRTGAVDPATLKALGRLFSVDGVVTGSFVTLGNESLVNARLIDVQTGLIIAAAERRTAREWFDSLGLMSTGPMGMDREAAAPELMAEPEAQEPAETAGVEAGCANAAERVDRLEASVLELKARYWARWLRQGGRLRELRFNPGSTITDGELRRRFYDRMRWWYEQEAVPELRPAEVKRFVEADQKAFALHRECRP